ncbi:hypothetical protein GCM10020295_31300 [Streptomyces cinereospinus]
MTRPLTAAAVCGRAGGAPAGVSGEGVRGLVRSALTPQYSASAPSSSATYVQLNSAKKKAHMPASSA